MKKYVLNYADKNFKSQQRYSSFFAKFLGRADFVFSYEKSDIDINFYSKHKKILDQNKGGGWWLWKPYFIKKTLEIINYGDYLFYQDSGSVLINKLDYIIDSLNIKSNDILTFSLPLIEKQWTNSYVLRTLKLDYNSVTETPQRLGGFLLIKKSKYSIDFIDKWLELCTDSKLITNEMNFHFGECDVFKGHRNDQSILSLLSKKYNIPYDADPSHRGLFLENYYGHIIIPQKKNNYPVLILLNRNKNPIHYFFWFFFYFTPKMKLWMWLKRKKHILHNEL